MTLVHDDDTHRRRRFPWPAGFRVHPPIITILIIAAIVATAWRTGVFHHDLGLTTEYQYAYSGRQIQAGHWSTLFTNQLLTRNTFMCLSICLSVLVFVGFYEALAGSVRAIVVIVVTGIVGPLGVEAGLGVVGSTTFISTAASGSSVAQVIEATYPSAALHSNRRVMVVLPPGYGRSGQRYPVVEMLHGVPGGLEEAIGGLNMAPLSSQSKTPFIVVAPDGTGPAVGESDFANTSSQPMGTVTGPELRQWVDAHYPTNGTWDVTGLSAGGYGAAYLPTLSPGAYQAACPMSGSFTAEPPAFAGQSAAVNQAGSPILHVSAGGPRTLLVAGSRDQESVDQARRYISAMNAVGEPNSGLTTNPGAHDLPVWTTGIKQCLGYFFPASGLHG